MIGRVRRRLGHYGIAWLASLGLFLLLLPLWLSATRWYETLLIAEQRAELVDTVSAYGNGLSSALNRRLARLQGLHAYLQIEAGDPTFDAKFEPFVAELLEGSSGVQYLSVSPGGVVRHIYPLDSEPVQAGVEPSIDAARRRALTSRSVELSSPQPLPSGEIRVVAWQAVYQAGGLWGLISMALDLAPLLAESGIDAAGDQVQLALRDDQGREFFGNVAAPVTSPVIVSINLPDGAWSLAGSPVDGWPASVERPLRVFQGVSFLVLLLLVALTFTVVNRQTQLTRAVAARTRDLMEAQQVLEDRVAERTHQLTMLLAVSADITSELTLLPLLRLILDQLQQTVKYVAASIMELDGDALEPVAYHGPLSQDEAVGRRIATADLGIIWTTIAAGQPCIIHDIGDDSHESLAMRKVMEMGSYHTGAGLRAWLGVPLQLMDRVIGLLALEHDQPGYFNEERVQLIVTFANHAAIAIENAHLYEQAQALAALQERQKLARDLHDSVSQALYGISLGARTARLLLDRDPGQLAEPLDYVLALAEAGLAEMRALIFELRPESLEREGLVVALDKQTAALRVRHHLNVETAFCEEPPLPLERKEALYRICQEALNNVVKHAQASRVLVNLSCADGVMELVIEDDGQGFEIGKAYPGHLGLRSMQERSEQMGGTFTVSSTPGEGTCVRVQVPYTAG